MRKLVPFFALISVFLTLYLIAETYAVFETNVTTGSTMNLAKWQVLVNASDIALEESEFTVDNVYWTTDSNVFPGRAAPSLSGYFEILIDPNNTEVSFEYELFFDFSELNNEYIYITSVVDSLSNPIVEVSPSTYRGVVTIDNIENEFVETVRVNFIWENNEENNIVDSTYVNQSDAYLNIPASIKLIQYIE